MDVVAAAYPAHWEADVVLRDGATAHLRPVVPGDAEAFIEFHSRLSSETVFFRYFAPYPVLRRKDVDRFTQVDYVDRVALVATLGGEIIGIGSYDVVAPGEAEVAFTIRDDHQARGIGSILLEHLAAAARERGITRFEASVLPANFRMLDVFAEAGYSPTSNLDDGVVTLAFDIEPTESFRRVREAREQRAEGRSVQRLLTPRSVVVIGASSREGSFGHTLLRNLLEAGFAGDVHVVHKKAEEIEGVPTVRSVTDIDGEVDLAVIAVPAPAVADVVRQCGEKGVRGLIVISSGFAEVRGDGPDRQRELVALAREHGMRVVGPNCLGVINTDPAVSLNASLSTLMPDRGVVGFFCQSGALGIAILAEVQRRGLGVSTFVSAGNRADLSGNDVMQYWDDDPATDVVMLYLESIGNPRKFSRLARRIARHTPIVAVKSGRSTQSTPLGHSVRPTTLPLDAVEEMFTQSGVIQTDTLPAMFDVAQVLAFQPLPSGRRVAVVGNSDALGLLAVDALRAADLAPSGDAINLGAQAKAADFDRALAAVLEDPAVDSVVAVFVPPLSTQGAGVVRVLKSAAVRSLKPITATVIGGENAGSADAFENAAELQRARDGGVSPRGSLPEFESVEEAVLALAAVTNYAEWRRRPAGEVPVFDDVDVHAAREFVTKVLVESPDGALLDSEGARELLGYYGISVWPTIGVNDEEGAVAAAQTVGLPVILRTTDRRHTGRTYLGGLALDLEDEPAVREAYRRMERQLDADSLAALVVQPTPPPGVGCLVSSAEDPLFGPVVSFGVSGVATELLRDQGYRIPPMTDRDAHDLVRTPRAAPLLFGFGGGEPVDTAALEELLLRVGRLADDVPELAELALAEVVVGLEGVAILGAYARIAPPYVRAESDVRRLSN